MVLGVDYVTGPSDVDDPRGSFEMLMHCVLFNMRIQARDPELKSDVCFVLCNHEIVSVFGFRCASDEWISEYVCERHAEFATPRTALKPPRVDACTRCSILYVLAFGNLR
jgi:hypothetical protein